MRVEKSHLHIGNNRTVRQDEIVGIFDMDTATVASSTKRFLIGMQKKGRILDVSGELPKSFLLAGPPCSAFGRIEPAFVYFSQLSPPTLMQRSGERISFENNSQRNRKDRT
ncbi:MAG: DUF370 domain-containing protein [Clostridia bacterium]|nr:DUF370 domain-containing protein [Clostridia bacterium]MBO4798348.1 DUF370 domain-containing protein [Candidatus Methanomethylophilaceae archaeon]MBQ4290112.1 DUF370 domain-containing protein [Clostridia bacterium]